MSGERIYVSHATADLTLVQKLFSTVKNFPFDVHIALEEVESRQSRKRLEGRLANSDVAVPVLTERSMDSPWINQEIGYAQAKGIPVVPVYDDASHRTGFITDVEGVSVDRTDPAVTIFNILSRLRSILAPLGALSVPNWYVQFPCTVPDCSHPVQLEIERSQTKLWKLHRHSTLLETACENCGSTYYFEPATIGFVRREGPTH
ncbi:toll/interleukin-1 receptor domain-containing protein [Salinadaptatus halalkaliphilus]|uniref:Toll/interleukin-1 receptor domain-containing protein n=1 Tax=Salinadaptatus halalkaliphilus TaxID=2419781 RepID=A0A4S3TP57_9EURY|nr:toll/interleukin-1 receptor domain-containing protein [Salinadaptatus halalkaliphilus]THE66071.1 toll/interleukin-1 receptor domain-containing protein [Salinadaptatus halalkaliphilus]